MHIPIRRFFDGVPLRAVPDLASLSPGTFFYDLDTGIIHVRNNPDGHVVETSITPVAFQPTAADVTIRNLIVTKYASVFQEGAIGGTVTGTGITGWKIDHVEATLNHGYGVRMPSASVLSHSYLHDNGEMGLGAGETDGVIISGNETSFNNYAGYDCRNECGGMKFGGVSNTTVIFNNAHNNLGHDAIGIWFDVDSESGTVSFNRFHDNTGPGVQIEISCHFAIIHNIGYRDGFSAAHGNWNAEIQFPATHDIEIAYNVVWGGYAGILGEQQARGRGGKCGPYVISNAWVHDNEIAVASTTGGSIAGLWSDDGTNIFTTHNVFYHNHYYMDNPSAALFSHNGELTFKQWQGQSPAQDRTSSIASWFSRTAYSEPVDEATRRTEQRGDSDGHRH